MATTSTMPVLTSQFPGMPMAQFAPGYAQPALATQSVLPSLAAGSVDVGAIPVTNDREEKLWSDFTAAGGKVVREPTPGIAAAPNIVQQFFEERKQVDISLPGALYPGRTEYSPADPSVKEVPRGPVVAERVVSRDELKAAGRLEARGERFQDRAAPMPSAPNLGQAAAMPSAPNLGYRSDGGPMAMGPSMMPGMPGSFASPMGMPMMYGPPQSGALGTPVGLPSLSSLSGVPPGSVPNMPMMPSAMPGMAPGMAPPTGQFMAPPVGSNVAPMAPIGPVVTAVEGYGTGPAKLLVDNNAVAMAAIAAVTGQVAPVPAGLQVLPPATGPAGAPGMPMPPGQFMGPPPGQALAPPTTALSGMAGQQGMAGPMMPPLQRPGPPMTAGMPPGMMPSGPPMAMTQNGMVPGQPLPRGNTMPRFRV